MKNHQVMFVTLATAIAMTACTRKDSAPSGDASAPAAAAAAPSATPTGKIVTVELNSDGAGNYFKPAKVEAHRGDILRFILKSGVHNVDFLADSNPGKSNLPAPSDMLQLPDQTLDIPVNFEPGDYYFQCDPHAALGMKGHLEVEH